MQRHTSNWWKQFYRGLYRVRQNNLCYYCQCEMDDTAPKHLANSCPASATLEHLYPRGHLLRGKTKSGWVTACWQCNQIKSAEWAKVLLERKCEINNGSAFSAESTRSRTGAMAGMGPLTPVDSRLPADLELAMSRCTVIYSLVPTLG